MCNREFSPRLVVNGLLQKRGEEECRRGKEKACGKADDQPTADLLTQRLEVHEKTAWMLRSLLEE